MPRAWHRPPGCLTLWDCNRLLWKLSDWEELSSAFWWRSYGTLIFQNPKPRKLTISVFWGAGLERESGESWE